jgi:hypothetical protein
VLKIVMTSDVIDGTVSPSSSRSRRVIIGVRFDEVLKLDLVGRGKVTDPLKIFLLTVVPSVA